METDSIFHHIEEVHFIADAHLGKLTRALRLLGFDTLYRNDLTAKEILAIAERQDRFMLPRSARLTNARSLQPGFQIRSEQPEKQLKEVINRFNLLPISEPFRRCLKCNGMIAKVPKSEVIDGLRPDTIRFFNEFYQCTSCKTVYWKGSHYERMLKLISDLRRSTP
ncbi:MAG TPA: Mut7-C RNAse domain-containing protein [Sphingobacteriaceae bacterium]